MYTTFVVWFKQCTKCKQLKPKTPDYFYRYTKASKRGDGLYPSCKVCKDSYRKTPKGREVVLRKTEKWRRTTEAGKRYQKAKQQRKYKRYPEKNKARNSVAGAIKNGKLLPVIECTCSMCEKQAEDYHHWTYEQEHWLDVIPLCRQCHNKLHRMNKQRRSAVEQRLRIQVVKVA
jgi:hypothetical protein